MIHSCELICLTHKITQRLHNECDQTFDEEVDDDDSPKLLGQICLPAHDLIVVYVFGSDSWNCGGDISTVTQIASTAVVRILAADLSMNVPEQNACRGKR